MNTREPAPPVPDESFDVPPPLVAAFPLAAAYWRECAPLLRSTRQITASDRGALISLCLEWGRYCDAIQKVQTAGLVVTTPSGYPMPNPYLPVATKALQACLKLWPELGMTPSSRSRVHTTEDTPADPFDEFDSAPTLTAH